MIWGLHQCTAALQVVMKMLAAPETPEEAVKRIARAVGGGQDDDDDDIIMGDTLPVNLRDPLSNLRVQRGVRVVGGKNLQPFDMDFFLDSAKRARKWQCPVSCAPPPHIRCCLLSMHACDEHCGCGPHMGLLSNTTGCLWLHSGAE